jgi:hypothetical protein
VAGSCEHGNEPLSSIKCGEFLDYLSVLLAFQEGLCSVSHYSNIVYLKKFLATNGQVASASRGYKPFFDRINHIYSYHTVALGGLVVSVLATGPEVSGFKPGRGRWILRVIKPAERLPSEGK